MYKKINEWRDSKPDSLQINPLQNFFDGYYHKTGSKGLKFNLIVLALLLGGSYGASYFITMLPQTIQGLIGGVVGIFVGLTAISIFMTREKQLNDKDSLSFKQLYTPQKRLNQGLIAIGIAAAIVIVASSYIPYILGSALSVGTLVLVYFYLIRTPDEIALYNSGEEDPREVVEREYAEAETEEESESISLNDEQLNEFNTLMSSLTDEQKKLLINQNNGFVIPDEKPEKKKGFFKKK